MQRCRQLHTAGKSQTHACCQPRVHGCLYSCPIIIDEPVYNLKGAWLNGNSDKDPTPHRKRSLASQHGLWSNMPISAAAERTLAPRMHCRNTGSGDGDQANDDAPDRPPSLLQPRNAAGRAPLVHLGHDVEDSAHAHLIHSQLHAASVSHGRQHHSVCRFIEGYFAT